MKIAQLLCTPSPPPVEHHLEYPSPPATPRSQHPTLVPLTREQHRPDTLEEWKQCGETVRLAIEEMNAFACANSDLNLPIYELKVVTPRCSRCKKKDHMHAQCPVVLAAKQLKASPNAATKLKVHRDGRCTKCGEAGHNRRTCGPGFVLTSFDRDETADVVRSNTCSAQL
ncbi:hypothetical protein FB451DRAFT_555045 [Mycena latifolia]|nr:hypothetical protein FB451DRAFT_555045 [Mycena latifolia]